MREATANSVYPFLQQQEPKIVIKRQSTMTEGGSNNALGARGEDEHVEVDEQVSAAQLPASLTSLISSRVHARTGSRTRGR